MTKDPLAQFAVEQAQSIVSPNGRLELDGVNGDVAYIGYIRKSAAECDMCLVTPEDLKLFLEEIFVSNAPHIKTIEIRDQVI